MNVVAAVAVGLVAFVHVVIGFVEMFLWTRPAIHGRLRPRVDITEDEAKRVAPIVANAGLYNWFMAAGLIWTLLPPGLGLLPAGGVVPARVFFLGCLMIAGAFGARTLSPRTLIIQTAFAAAALVAVWLASCP